MSEISHEAIKGKIQRYEELRSQADALKEQVAEVNRQRDALEAEIIAGMLDLQEQLGVDDFSMGVDGRKYKVTVKHFYSITKANRDAAYPLLRDLGLGDLITEKVDDRTLTKELSAVADENGGMLPDEYSELMEHVSAYDKPSMSRVKA